MNDPEEVEGLLNRFREWLGTVRFEAQDLDRAGPGPGPERHEPEPELGLIDLVEEFTALRHELKLQTKSGRGLLEQAESMVSALRQAIEQFRSVEPKEAQAVWAAGKVLAEALADLDEALVRGRREIEKAGRRIAEESIDALARALDDRFGRRSWIRRRLSVGYHQEVLQVVREAGRVRRELFDSLLEGYGLIQNRLSRVMKAERIERIPCEGQPVDPERMVVIDVLEDPSRPPGTVVKEFRSGYTWRGRLLRYAEVQAASATRRAPAVPVGVAELASVHDGEIGRNGESDADGDTETGIELDIETDRNAGIALPDSD
jgi:molecular chaperone GrpE